MTTMTKIMERKLISTWKMNLKFLKLPLHFGLSLVCSQNVGAYANCEINAIKSIVLILASSLDSMRDSLVLHSADVRRKSFPNCFPKCSNHQYTSIFFVLRSNCFFLLCWSNGISIIPNCKPDKFACSVISPFEKRKRNFSVNLHIPESLNGFLSAIAYYCHFPN